MAEGEEVESLIVNGYLPIATKAAIVSSLAPEYELECKRCGNKEPKFFSYDGSGHIACSGVDGRGCGGTVDDEPIETTRRAIMSAHASMSSKRDGFVVPDVTHKWACKVCGNKNPAYFTHDTRGGDVICNGKDGTGCGNVVEERHRHEGAAFRNFQDDKEDRNHHGPAADRLYSAAHNMRTELAGKSASAVRLRQTYEQVELGLSNLGKDEKRTRIGYKDQHKKKASNRIKSAVLGLSLHPSISDRAHELFASLRDEREAIHRFDLVLAACTIQAAEEAAKFDLSASKTAPDNKPVLKATRRSELLKGPLAAAKRARHSGPELRVGKGWIAQLDDLQDDVRG
ncbi:hypothetical protein CTAYLR_002457 [Chrysophaeum taylorii]|uniref:Uncharacterized protein n=1 Tax=Chrysophaeum taylorii TaxID=2483200 RepID=A0AAD7XQZ0_9STRA|nr:hypothetical protein CTAYLR_002457 [Chrysophaeum taylorii]